MKENLHIVYPALVMFVFTISTVFTLGICRFRAIKARKVSVKYYRLYNEGKQPDDLQLMGRHVQNHFEIPPLFYIAVLFCYVLGATGIVALIAAWSFVFFRVLHAIAHLGGNNVSRRFFVFALSLVSLTALWGQLIVHVVGLG